MDMTEAIKKFIDEHMDIIGPGRYGNTSLEVTDSHYTNIAKSDMVSLTSEFITSILGTKPAYDTSEYKVYYQKMLVLIFVMDELRKNLPTPSMYGLPNFTEQISKYG